MKPADIKSSTSVKKIAIKTLNMKLSKIKSTFAKGYVPNSLEEVFGIK